MGICAFIIPFVGFVLAIVALVLGITGKKKTDDAGVQSGMSMAGIIVPAVAVGLSILIIMCTCYL